MTTDSPDPIIPALPPLVEPRDLTLFIPRAIAAVCADCGGVFYAPGRKACPGCGSGQWALLETIDRPRDAARED